MNYCTKINLLRTLDEAKESCWKGEIMGVVGIITYQDGAYLELIMGEVDPEMMYVKVHQIAHQLLEKSLVRKEEI